MGGDEGGGRRNVKDKEARVASKKEKQIENTSQRKCCGEY